MQLHTARSSCYIEPYLDACHCSLAGGSGLAYRYLPMYIQVLVLVHRQTHPLLSPRGNSYTPTRYPEAWSVVPCSGSSCQMCQIPHAHVCSYPMTASRAGEQNPKQKIPVGRLARLTNTLSMCYVLLEPMHRIPYITHYLTCSLSRRITALQ